MRTELEHNFFLVKDSTQKNVLARTQGTPKLTAFFSLHAFHTWRLHFSYFTTSVPPRPL
jgi:hypothetical protein